MKTDLLKQWTCNLENLQKANEQVKVFVEMRAVFAPFKTEFVPIEEIDAKLPQYQIVFRDEPIEPKSKSTYVGPRADIG
jgi:hypothetical protein